MQVRGKALGTWEELTGWKNQTRNTGNRVGLIRRCSAGGGKADWGGAREHRRETEQKTRKSNIRRQLKGSQQFEVIIVVIWW